MDLIYEKIREYPFKYYFFTAETGNRNTLLFHASSFSNRCPGSTNRCFSIVSGMSERSVPVLSESRIVSRLLQDCIQASSKISIKFPVLSRMNTPYVPSTWATMAISTPRASNSSLAFRPSGTPKDTCLFPWVIKS